MKILVILPWIPSSPKKDVENQKFARFEDTGKKSIKNVIKHANLVTYFILTFFGEMLKTKFLLLTF